jgi:hypothetical protein
MSVPVRDRGESVVQYLANAEEIKEEVLSFCMKLPKRLGGYMGHGTLDEALRLANCVRAANGRYPVNRPEAQKRRELLNEANDAIQALIGNITTIRNHLMKNPEIFAEGMKEETEDQRRAKDKKVSKGKRRVWNATERLASLLNEEAKLISGVKDADRKRYKNLPDF